MSKSKKNGSKNNRGKKSGYKSKNPKRGGPGVLITCERGREYKSQREGLELLSHYYYHKNDHANKKNQKDSANGADPEKKKQKLSLEEEIQMLRGGASADLVLIGDHDKKESTKNKNSKKKAAPFHNYDTGCCGIVFLMCTSPDSFILESKNQKQNNEPQSQFEESENEENLNKDPKKRKLEEGDATTDESKIIERAQSVWDPIETIQSIFKDAKAPLTHNAPSSRFITRIIPIQTTCFANMEEITHSAKYLIDNLLLPYGKKERMMNDKKDTRTTFSIAFKRRNCSNVKREDVISKVAELVDVENFKVDLSHPEFTISIEVCRTLCGMSILHNIEEYKKFNLFETRQGAQNEDD